MAATVPSLLALGLLLSFASESGATACPGSVGDIGLERGVVGSCHLLGCSAARGPTDCVQGECVCQTDTCADKGDTSDGKDNRVCLAAKCPEDSIEPVGSCAWLGCSSHRGPTDCINGRCVCKSGFCGNGRYCRAFLPGDQCDKFTENGVFVCSAGPKASTCDKDVCLCKFGLTPGKTHPGADYSCLNAAGEAELAMVAEGQDSLSVGLLVGGVFALVVGSVVFLVQGRLASAKMEEKVDYITLLG